MSNRSKIWHSIALALKADKSNRNYPVHMAARAGRVVEKSGSLMKAAMDYKYTSDMSEEVQIKIMEDAAIKTAVQAIRFLQSLKTENEKDVRTDNITVFPKDA